MPELPEVETIKRLLKKNIIGKKIAKVKILSQKQFPDKPQLIVSSQIVGLERQGKQLIINFNNHYSLLIHLKLTGQLVFGQKLDQEEKAYFDQPIPFNQGNVLPGKTTRVIIYLMGKNNQPDGAIFFNDLRKFGWLRIIPTANLKEQNLKKLGVEPLSKSFTPLLLAKIFGKTKKPIKLVLMDQEKIAGVGNIYANEALFEARILPTRSANSLTSQEIKKLHQAINLVLKKAIKAGGSSASDEAFIKPDGTPGGYQKITKVYQKEGKPCPRCGSLIKRINLQGRGTFFCPKCQV